MSERDELATIIGEQVEHPAGPECCICADVNRAAAAVETMGYRKHRTITTLEELDALPPWSVVLSASYTSQSGQRISFQRWEDDGWHRGARSGSTHPDNFLPATVLYEPAP